MPIPFCATPFAVFLVRRQTDSPTLLYTGLDMMPLVLDPQTFFCCVIYGEKTGSR